ncbi:MAG: 2Fe-2S iron-sulfur cluster-binding protein [Gammaproteobacteria bacterium]
MARKSHNTMSYRVIVKPAGISFVVHDQETVLEAALRCGYFFPHCCRMGVCTACKGKVMSGEIDYAGSEIIGLTEAERAEGYALFCCAQPKTDLVIQVEDASGAQSYLPKQFVYDVVRCESLAENVMRIILKPSADEHLVFQAGQYIKVVHQDDSLSPLSIASIPGFDLELHLAYSEENASSQDVLRMARVEKKLTLRGPYGNCTVADIQCDLPIIFLARGTGFASIKAMVEQLKEFQKYPAMHLYWGVTDRKELYLDSLAKRWVTELEYFSYTPVLSRDDESWGGKIGLLQDVILQDFPSLVDYQVYASAPESIVHDALHEFQRAGLRRGRYYSDVFDYDPDA